LFARGRSAFGGKEKMKLFKIVEDYKKEKTNAFPISGIELQNIEEIVKLDKEVQKIQRLYKTIAKPNDISKEEQEKLQFGSYQYSTGV
jgi:hypothetical protein